MLLRIIFIIESSADCFLYNILYFVCKVSEDNKIPTVQGEVHRFLVLSDQNLKRCKYTHCEITFYRRVAVCTAHNLELQKKVQMLQKQNV